VLSTWTNGEITVSARSGPISARTAPSTACSASATGRAPITCLDTPSAEPTATVDGTSVRTAKTAISAARPVVRWTFAARGLVVCAREPAAPGRYAGGPEARVKVTLYTDPGCPFGFNAQRQELQLMWHYGHGAEIERRMIVLAERSSSFEDRGLSPDLVARSRERLATLYGMPMGTEPVTQAAATIDACRA
jgi:hypothetical protein